MKTCSKCKLEKPLTEYQKDNSRADGYAYVCKSCRKISRRQNYLKNKEKSNEQSKSYYQSNKEKMNAHNKSYYEKNKKRLLKLRRDYKKAKRLNDPLYRLENNIRRRINKTLRNKPAGTLKLLGCDWLTLRAHLESQFKDGMTWENYGFYGWHVDHIKPLSTFDLTQEDQIYEANHYTNLQPLWAEDNLRKHNKWQDSK